MDIYFAADDQQQGPIALEELHRRIQAGELNHETLVFTEGMTEWASFKTAVEKDFVPGLPASTPIPKPQPSNPLRIAKQETITTMSPGSQATVACPTCGIEVPATELIPLQDRKVCPHCRDRVLQQIREGVAVTTTTELRYAGFGPRLASAVIDYIIMQVYSQIVSFATLGASSFDSTSQQNVSGVILVIYFVLSIGGNLTYLIYFMGSARHQATLGMKALKLKVVRSDGSPITKRRALGRYFASMLSGMILMIGYFMLLWDKEKATLHDRIADTRIVFK